MMRSRDTPISVAVVRVLGDGADAAAELRPVDREIGQHREDQRGGDDDQSDVGDSGAEDRELSLGLYQDDRLLGVAAAVTLEQFRQDEVDEFL